MTGHIPNLPWLISAELAIRIREAGLKLPVSPEAKYLDKRLEQVAMKQHLAFDIIKAGDELIYELVNSAELKGN